MSLMSPIMTVVCTCPSDTNRVPKYKGSEALRRVQQSVCEYVNSSGGPYSRRIGASMWSMRIDFRVSV